METRFDCAYTAIRAVADAALLKECLEQANALLLAVNQALN